ncbi:MAG: hypothetical protein EPO02_00335 [Nitrospirae bacterium]|nr:MAG: hypothetical protein EPO02_00335 [Nitrospirota bacterium]
MASRRVSPLVVIAAGLWLLTGPVCPPAASAAEKPEDFYDEVGRLLYSIDAQGVVSMFETDALDNTLSVTRGTRESLQPRVTEVSPPSVETGKITVVTFKGRNLVGAKFSAKVPGIKFGGSAPRAASAGVPIEVDGSVKLGPITIDLRTPIGMTSVSLTVIEPQIDLAALARKKEPEYREFPAGKPESCPEGMIAVASSKGGFCIDINQTQAGDWVSVEKMCSYKFKRLCWAEEWDLACKDNQKNNLGLQNLLGEWEWTRNSEYAAAGVLGSGGLDGTENEDWLAVVRGKEDCGSKGRKDPWLSGTRPGRCCK